MAQVLAKIFNNKKYHGCSSQGKSQAKSNSRWHVPRFSKENINLVIFKDHAVKGRQPILDSRSVRKVTLRDLLCEKCKRLRIPSKRCVRQSSKDKCTECPGIYANPSTLPKYKSVCSSTKNDLRLIGEMVFGTAPLANTGTTVKVHSLRNPHQLMLSLVFSFIKRCEDTTLSADFDELSLDFFESSVFGMPKRGSESNLSNMASSVGSGPVDMPRKESGWGSDNSLNLSVSSNSLQTPIPSPGASSTTSIVSGSKLCMMRRLRRSWNRSLQYNTLSMKSNSSGGNNSIDSSDSPQTSVSEPGTSTPLRKKCTRIGLAVMFGLDEFDDSRRDFENFFFSHITLIEGQLAQLRLAVEKSACEPRDRVQVVIMEALERLQQNVYDLYTAPRLHSPVWLSMMASSSQRLRICDKFVQEFILLIDRYDTRSTNYFVSSLLTGVLMYHLAWVPTVTPSGEAHSSYADKHSPKWLDMLAKSHPYNPLWAQLSDMYGAIGIPPRLARTIVTGKKIDTIMKFLFVLSYFIRCSEIHETFDECYDEEYMLSQIESAVGDICIESMEKEVSVDDGFVFVDPPCSSPYLGDTESDSGLVSQYTGQSRTTRQLTDGTTPDSESGFIEPPPSESKGPLSDVTQVPSSSPADKVREWICTSQLTESASIPAAGISRFQRPTSLPSNSSMQKSCTSSTLVVDTEASPCMTPSHLPSVVELARPPPADSRLENVRALGRSVACVSLSPEVTPECSREVKTSSGESEKSTATLRVNLVRLFSSETRLDEFSEYFDGKPPNLHRQLSQLSDQSNSMFNEYFEGLESLSQVEDGNLPTPISSTPSSGSRDVLFKVLKETGFHQTLVSSSLNSSAGGQTTPTEHPHQAESPVAKQSASRTNSGANTYQPLPLSEDQGYRPRGHSVGMQSKSSRCSTPQTIKNGGATTPTSDVRMRHPSACVTILSDTADDPFNSFTEIDMPRSKRVSKLADTSISTTSFGRQQLASFSDHYLSDFVLHGTSDEDTIPKVQEDLTSAVTHSVLEDPISEAVCVVADTERWTVNVCSSMSKQPKPLRAAHLVSNMIETVTNLSKLKMSSEFILHHMEDRLQEMYFKSRMLAEYIKSRKKVDMDELGAMFGLESNDIRFLLSVTATHSTLNLHGIY